MNAIILDTNIIIKYPRILSLKIPNTDIFITSEILLEVQNRAQNSISQNETFVKLLELIQNALDAKTLVVNPITENDLKKIDQTIQKNTKLTLADKSLVALAGQISHAYPKVAIATMDIQLINILYVFQIEILDGEKIQKLINENKATNDVGIEEKAARYETTVNRSFLKGIIIGILVTLVIFTFALNFQKISQTINVWGTIVLAILIGISLFAFREKQRLSYGVFEFLTGIGTIIFIFYPDFDYSKLDYTFDFYAKMLGGLYIMVRGQDNIVKSLAGKKWGLWLKEKTGIG